jgi:hypothetical protein
LFVTLGTKSFRSGQLSEMSIIFLTWKRLCYPHLALSPGLGFRIITLELSKNCVKCSSLKYSADKKFQFSIEKLSASSSSFTACCLCWALSFSCLLLKHWKLMLSNRIELLCARNEDIFNISG